MKLAEALAERKGLEERIQGLGNRLTQGALVVEGDRLNEDPDALLQALDEALAAWAALVVRINRTNSRVRTEDGMTLTEALAERDRLRKRRQILENVANASAGRPPGMPDRVPVMPPAMMAARMGGGARLTPGLEPTRLHQLIDETQAAYRRLDNHIQAAGWAADLDEA